jgi:hypothetical protein
MFGEFNTQINDFDNVPGTPLKRRIVVAAICCWTTLASAVRRAGRTPLGKPFGPLRAVSLSNGSGP